MAGSKYQQDKIRTRHSVGGRTGTLAKELRHNKAKEFLNLSPTAIYLFFRTTASATKSPPRDGGHFS